VVRGNSLKEYLVEGTTFAPHGSVTSLDGQGGDCELRSEPVQRLAQICAICNDAKVVFNSVRRPIALVYPFHVLTVQYRTVIYTLTLENLRKQL
jgi:hypothetical protein